MLICPMLDDRFQTHSSRMLDEEGCWDRNDNLYGWTALLGDRRGGPDVSPYAAPARAEDLVGLPRTYIDVGSVDTFRDEALTYAGRLSEAGVLVDLHMWGGAFHGFDAWARGARPPRSPGRLSLPGTSSSAGRSKPEPPVAGCRTRHSGPGQVAQGGENLRELLERAGDAGPLDPLVLERYVRALQSLSAGIVGAPPRRPSGSRATPPRRAPIGAMLCRRGSGR